MSAHKKTADRKSGGILVVVMLMTLIVSIMALAMYKLQASGGVAVVRAKQSQQAFWLAEAGLRDAIQRLNWNLKENPSDVTGYRESPYVIVSNNVGKGSYEVDIPGVNPAGFNSTNYTITAVGRVLGINRRVRQMITVRPGSKFAIILKGGDSEFNSNTEISDGGVAVFNGSLDTGLNSTVELGDVYTDSDVTLTGNGDYTQVPMPSELEEPTFNPANYQTTIATVVASGTATGTYTTNAVSISGISSYTSNSVTFSARPTVDSGAVITSYGDIIFDRTTTFNGPVTIEAGGDVIFNQSSDLPAGSTIIAGGDVVLAGSIAVGSNVEIVAGGDVAFGQQTSFAGHSVFYAENALSVASGGSSSVSGDGIAFLSNGDITINSNMDPFRGLMFANGELNFNANMDIYGTVVGELGVDATSNVDFFYDLSAYAWALDSAGIDITGLATKDAILTRERWQELRPL